MQIESKVSLLNTGLIRWIEDKPRGKRINDLWWTQAKPHGLSSTGRPNRTSSV